MSQQISDQQQAIFQTSNKLILRQWTNINPNKQLNFITAEKLSVFLKNVFQLSKNQLQMEIDPDTDYKELIHDYREDTNQQDKNQFTYQEAIKVLNWAVDPQIENQPNQNTPQNMQNTNDHQEKSQKSQKNLQKYNINNKNYQQTQDKSTQILLSNSEKYKAQIKHQNNQPNPKDQCYHKNKKEQKQSHNSQKKTIQQKQFDIKQTIGYQQESQSLKQNIKLSIKQNPQHNQNYLDWGELYDQDKRKLNLYKSINSYRPTKNHLKNELQKIIQSAQQKPIDIKKSSAKISLKKQKAKINQQKLLQLPVDDPKAPQIKYIKKHKIVIKSKPKPQFKPQIMGLKELFKFYCALHSQHSYKKSRNPQKGTFDQVKSNILQLYMHNFMLFCKDFSIVETRKAQNEIKINISTVHDNDNSQGNELQSNRLSQGQVSLKEKDHKIFKRNRGYVKEESDIWDRDRLCGYFKKQADYSLHVKYDMFVEIMKFILRNKLTVETEAEEVFDEGGGNDEQQNENSQSNHRIDPYVLALCQYFKVDTQQNFKQTMNRLKIQYKMIDADSLRTKTQQKKVNNQLNGHFKQHFQQHLKIRQLEKQNKRVQIKQKYFDKYNSPDNDIYSSFRAAKIQTNSANAIYGSAPKLTPLNFTHSNQFSIKKSNKNNNDSDLHQLRKNINKNYNSSSQIGNILKEARLLVMQDKENPSNFQDNTVRLAKSKFNLFETEKQKNGQNIFHQHKQPKQEQKSLSSGLINRSRLIVQNGTKRSQKAHILKDKSKETTDQLLQKMGFDSEDDLLEKYFDQQKHMQKPKIGANHL